jgi:hypothetical protein
MLHRGSGGAAVTASEQLRDPVRVSGRKLALEPMPDIGERERLAQVFTPAIDHASFPPNIDGIRDIVSACRRRDA